jgi:hypothetical protein
MAAAVLVAVVTDAKQLKDKAERDLRSAFLCREFGYNGGHFESTEGR